MSSGLFSAVALWMLVCSSCVERITGDESSHQNNIDNERSIKIEGDHFVLDGAEFRYVSGSLHYFRVPRAHWRDRLRKLRVAGLNAVSTYVEWSFHEPEEGQYRWTGDHDLVHFLELAAQENLLVLLRPGPYICAERDLGGHPYWLLSKYPDIELRTTDPDYMREAKKWLDLLFDKVRALLYGNGGPIILVQVENEYGSFGCDAAYMGQLRDIMKEHVGAAALLYTTDGTAPSMLRCGSVNGTLTTIDFGTGNDPAQTFKVLRQFLPTGPLVNSEFYPGWLTHWGQNMQRVGSERVIRTLTDMLQLNASVNFYVFFGGTNFEFSAGANFGGVYEPDITSYDYDAPLTENGNITQKYTDIKNTLEKYHPWARDLQVEQGVAPADYGTVQLAPQTRLLSERGRAALGVDSSRVEGDTLPTFEGRRQRAGLMLYEITVPSGDQTRLLHVAKPRDRVYVFVDGIYRGVISRMLRILSLPIQVKDNSTLSLLVESQGRINFGDHLKDFKGILGNIVLDQKILRGNWSVLGFPLEELNTHEQITTEQPEGALERGPVLFTGSFKIPEGETPRDTYLNPKGWGKGYAWINGHNLGRYWLEPGPQVTLYVPAAYLHAAPRDNLLQLVELESAASSVRLVDQPIFSTH